MWPSAGALSASPGATLLKKTVSSSTSSQQSPKASWLGGEIHVYLPFYAGSWSGFVHAVTVTVNSYVQLLRVSGRDSLAHHIWYLLFLHTLPHLSLCLG